MSTTGWDLLKRAKSVLNTKMPYRTELVFDAVGGDSRLPEESELRRNRDYFGLTVNQIWLRDGQQLFSTYDPLVYVAVDFPYGSQRVTVPKIIGPSALKSGLSSVSDKLPHGFVVRDIRAVGPHPYRGEQVGITVILYKVKHTDYAKRVLGFTEKLSSALGFPADIVSISKIGGSMIDAIETLFDMGDSEPVLGHRIELNASPMYGFQPRSVALISADVGSNAGLNVSAGRLLSSSGADYRSDDYVLYTVWGTPSCENETRLPFHSLVKKIKECARAGDDLSWQRGKALLMTLYQQMLESDDITETEAGILFAQYKNEMLEQRDLSRSLHEMSTSDSDVASQGVHRKEILENRLNEQAREIFSTTFESRPAA